MTLTCGCEVEDHGLVNVRTPCDRHARPGDGACRLAEAIRAAVEEEREACLHDLTFALAGACRRDGLGNLVPPQPSAEDVIHAARARIRSRSAGPARGGQLMIRADRLNAALRMLDCLDYAIGFAQALSELEPQRARLELVRQALAAGARGER